ncbi:MAG: hypothetical protein WC476_01305 [Phycisphaerae bacterium]|jgi:hypothetical protein
MNIKDWICPICGNYYDGERCLECGHEDLKEKAKLLKFIELRENREKKERKEK